MGELPLHEQVRRQRKQRIAISEGANEEEAPDSKNSEGKSSLKTRKYYNLLLLLLKNSLECKLTARY